MAEIHRVQPPSEPEPPTPIRMKFPLRLKISLMAGILTVVPLLTVGLILIDINATEIEDRIKEFQVAIASDVARVADGEVDGAIGILQAVGNALTNPDINEDSRLAAAAAIVGAAESLDQVTLYDAKGQVIDSFREDGAPVGDRAPLDEALRKQAEKNEVAVGPAEALGEGLVVPVVVPIHGKVTWFAKGALSTAAIDERVERLAGTHFADLKMPMFLVDAQRRVVATGGAPELSVLQSAPDIPLLGNINAQTLSGNAASSDLYTFGGEKIFGSMMGLPRLGWVAIVQQPSDVVFGSLRLMRLTVIITVSTAICLALLIALYLSRRISAPLTKLANFAKDLAERRFDRRVVVETQDELAVLGQAMSTAAQQLQYSEQRIRNEVAIRTDLGRYLPSELVEQVVRREQDMGLGGKRTEITVIFADVVAFTPLTKRLEPEVVVGVLNELFTILTEIVFRHGGTVDKFVGDCVMAMWGAPKPSTDHATKAVAAAEEMLEWLEVGNARWQKQHGVTLQLAIGANTGYAIVGNIGSETRMEYTAIGDVVNVAARLETIARPMQLLVSEATRVAAGNDFDYLPLGAKEMAGRDGAIELFEVVI